MAPSRSVQVSSVMNASGVRRVATLQKFVLPFARFARALNRRLISVP
jgi:hypothetical protein